MESTSHAGTVYGHVTVQRSLRSACQMGSDLGLGSDYDKLPRWLKELYCGTHPCIICNRSAVLLCASCLCSKPCAHDGTCWPCVNRLHADALVIGMLTNAE